MKRRFDWPVQPALLLVMLAIGFAGMLVLNSPAATMERDVARTIDALTRDKVQQQTALDDIAKWPVARRVLLYRYLDDHRVIASRDVLLLNTFPSAFEKYFMTGGNTVSDAVAEFLCWTTEACDYDLRASEPVYRNMQYRALRAYCLSHFEERYCPSGRARQAPRDFPTAPSYAHEL